MIATSPTELAPPYRHTRQPNAAVNLGKGPRNWTAPLWIISARSGELSPSSKAGCNAHIDIAKLEIKQRVARGRPRRVR